MNPDPETEQRPKPPCLLAIAEKRHCALVRLTRPVLLFCNAPMARWREKGRERPARVQCKKLYGIGYYCIYNDLNF